MPHTAIVQSVSDVSRATQPLPEASPKEAIEALIHCKVEACSQYLGKVIVSDYHPFVATVHAAFSDHRPLVLSPDMLWLLIAQGFALHVNANSEGMRRRFVQYDGKRNWQFSGEGGHGITTDSLPGSLCSAPFTWQYLDRQYKMQFVAGFIGFTQTAQDFAVRPKIGWAVCEV